jgi:hypothetical protein
MSDQTIREAADSAASDILENGQYVMQGDMQVTRASLRDVHGVLTHEDNRAARKAGRRPLMRAVNLSAVN